MTRDEKIEELQSIKAAAEQQLKQLEADSNNDGKALTEAINNFKKNFKLWRR